MSHTALIKVVAAEFKANAKFKSVGEFHAYMAWLEDAVIEHLKEEGTVLDEESHELEWADWQMTDEEMDKTHDLLDEVYGPHHSFWQNPDKDLMGLP